MHGIPRVTHAPDRHCWEWQPEVGMDLLSGYQRPEWKHAVGTSTQATAPS
jgi:hypothetical protein